MIEKREIIDVARVLGLTPQVVEKDYVLGWLRGIHKHPRLGTQWAFKGGTCLKKCYFETYRFSEDLDFTVRDAALMEPEFLKTALQEVCARVTEMTNIQFPGDAVSLDVHPDPEKGYIEGKVSYVGPLLAGGSSPRIRLDLNSTELLVHEPEERDVHHPYSDEPAEGIQAWSYVFEEVFAEKIRALAERARPRDLYDVIHLHRRAEGQVDLAELYQVLEKKCAYKKIGVPTYDTIDKHPKREELAREWENMLRHQVQALPALESFFSELPAFFDWLTSTEDIEEEAPDSAAVMPAILSREAIDTSWTMPARITGHDQPSGWLETIRFAGANRICINLDYRDKTGKRSSRFIEPYKVFRSMKDGVLCLFAIRREDGQTRIYRFDGIQGMVPTNEGFAPRYPIEVDQIAQAVPRSPRSSGFSGRRVRSHSGGPQYIYRCPACGKEFSRKSYGEGRSGHKDPNGYDCHGRPYYVRTRY